MTRHNDTAANTVTPVLSKHLWESKKWLLKTGKFLLLGLKWDPIWWHFKTGVCLIQVNFCFLALNGNLNSCLLRQVIA